MLVRALGYLATFGTACAMLSACSTREAPVGGGGDRQGRLISAEEIRQSGATDAWDLLRRSGVHLRMGESRSGEPLHLSRRGPASILLNQAPTVVLDGAHLADFSYLRRIPALSILRVEILSGIEGTRRFGTGAGNGAIVIETGAKRD
jgi:hypothetical protein